MSQQPDVEETTRAIRVTVNGYSYSRSVYEVHQEFAQLDPAAIGDACTAWKRAADELVALADDLRTRAAVPLDAAWQDTGASARAQTQLQYAEATARALANDCLTMAHATDYAAQYAQWYKDNLPSYTDSVVAGVGGLLTGNGLDSGAEQAVTHMVRLLSRYNEVIATLPSQLQAKAVHSTAHDLTLDGSLPAGGPAVPGISGPAGGAPGFPTSGAVTAVGPHAGGLVGAAHGVGTGVPGSGTGASGAGSEGAAGGAGSGYDPYAPGTTLAGGTGGGLGSFDPVGASGSAGGAASGGGLGGAGLGALGAGAAGAAGLGAGRIAAGLGRAGAGLAGTGVGGPGAVGVAPGGVIGGPGGSGAGGAGAGRGAGRPGAPGAAGAPAHGAGGDEEERERSTWLLEDEDVWSGDADVPPPVIGG